MSPSDFKFLVEQAATKICERDPLGFRAAALQVAPLPILTSCTKGTTETSLVIKFSVNGDVAGKLKGELRRCGRVTGLEGILYESVDAWAKKGVGEDILRRFTHVLFKNHFSYMATGGLTINAPLFEELGFFKVPKNVSLGVSLASGRKVEEIAGDYPADFPAQKCRAVLDFNNAAQRNKVFASMGLPNG